MSRVSILKSILISISFVIVTDVCSQDRLNHAVFVEFLGNGGLYSVNYEYQTLDKTIGRVGIAVYPEAVAVPITIGKLIGRSNDLLEVAIGATPLTYYDEGDDSMGTTVFLTGVIGYRYQRPDNRFMFRVGFTPLINIYDVEEQDFNRIIPLGGMSFGFRF